MNETKKQPTANHRQAEEALRQPNRELELLTRASRAFNSSLDLEQVLTAILTEMCSLLNATASSIWLFEAETQESLVCRQATGPQSEIVRGWRLAAGQGIAGWVASHGENLIIPNLQRDERYFSDVGEKIGVALHSMISVPLQVKDQVIGVVQVMDTEPNRFDATDLTLLEPLAATAAIAIENASLYKQAQQEIVERRRAEEALERRAEQLTALTQMSQAVTASLEIDQVLTRIVSLASEVTATDYASVVLVDETGLPGTGAENLPGVPALEYRFRANGFTNWIVHSHRPVIIDTIDEDGKAVPAQGEGAPRFVNPPIVEAGIKSLAGLPLMARGRLQGVLYLHAVRPNAFHDQLPLLTAFANQAAIAIENARLYKALQESEEMYKTLVDTSPDAVTMTDLAGAITYASRRTLEMHGFEHPTEMLGRSAFDLIAPEDHERARANLQQTVGAGTVRSAEYQLLRKDGTRFNGELNAALIKDVQGAPKAFVATTRDITARKRVEKALQQHTERLRTLHAIDSAILAAWSAEEIAHATLQHIRQLIPCQAANVTTLDHETQEAVVLATHGDGKVKVAAGSRFPLEGIAEIETLRQGKALVIEDISTYPFIGREPGDPPPAIQTLQALDVRSLLVIPLLSHGELIGAIFMRAETSSAFTPDHVEIASEVGNQLAVALHQARLHAALEAERKRLETLVQHLPEGVLLLDKERHLLLVNPVAEHYLACLIDAEARAEVQASGVLTRLADWPTEELTHAFPDGLWRELEVTGPPKRLFGIAAKPIKAETEIGGWVLLVWDVTHEREIEWQMQQQERLAAVGRLAGGIAHDFNNYLTTIMLYAQILLGKSHLPQDLAPAVKTILNETRQAAQLVQQILDFSRRSMMEVQQIDLAAFVEDTVGILRRTLPEHIRLLVELRAEEHDLPLTVNADLTRLQQTLMNLVLNARDAMPEGGDLRIGLSRVRATADKPPPTPEMERAWMPGVEWICLSISDTGTGIPPDVLPHIYEPFFTTKEQGAGTGLGLAQVYGIVKQHGGHIGIETAIRCGTTFHVYLPAYRGDDAKDYQAPTEPPALPEGQGETILLVEDEKRVREAGREILESLGYRVLTAENGQQGLEMYRSEEKVDLVLTDLVMPEMGGEKLIQELREVDATVKALAITGYVLTDNLPDLKEAGILDIIQKPLDVGKLAKAIRRALDTQ